MIHRIIVCIDFLDRLINRCLLIFCLLLCLLMGYYLYDSWRILDTAGSESLLRYKPTAEVAEKDDQSAGFDLLMQMNPEVAGWLSVDQTQIDYPVCHCEDNVKYVNTDATGAYAVTGALFLDCRDHSDFSDPYLVIYGHHMQNGAMFGALDYFMDASFFKAHPEGVLYLRDGTSRHIHWFACISADAYDLMIYNNSYLRKMDTSETDLEDIYTYILSNSIQTRRIEFDPSGQLIALSTCSDAGARARTLLVGMIYDKISFDNRVEEAYSE